MAAVGSRVVRTSTRPQSPERARNRPKVTASARLPTAATSPIRRSFSGSDAIMRLPRHRGVFAATRWGTLLRRLTEQRVYPAESAA
jgi:hypothetical protein